MTPADGALCGPPRRVQVDPATKARACSHASATDAPLALSGPIPHRPGKGKLHVLLLVRAYDDGVRDGRAKSPDPGPRTGPSDLPYTGRSGQAVKQAAFSARLSCWQGF